MSDFDFESWLNGDPEFANYWSEKTVFPADTFSACLESNFLLERILYEIYKSERDRKDK